jgi:hypothetical protein
MTPRDHIAEGLAHVVTQYRDKPGFLVYLAVFLEQIRLCENALVDIYNAFRLDSATGFRLDWVGRKVGQNRVGSTDDVYRTYIKGRIAANRSRGSTLDVIRVAKAVLTNARYEQRSCTILVYTTDALTQELYSATVDLLTQAAGPGIKVHLIATVTLPVFAPTHVGVDGELFAQTDTDGAPVAAPTYLARVTVLD